MQANSRSRLRKIALVIGIPALLLIGGPVFLAIYVIAHRPTQERVSVDPPPPSAASLAEILARPRPIRVETLNTGIVALEKTVLLNPDHPNFAKFDGDDSDILVYAHILRHPAHGPVLIDSGLDSSFTDSTTGNVGGPARLWMAVAGITFHQKPGQDIAAQLEARGVTPEAVYFTHLHLDHTTGLPELPARTRLFTGPGEGDDPLYMDAGHLDRFDRLHELDFTNAVDLRPLGRGVDLYGDGSFWAILTPGHTDGHLSFLVNSDRGAVLLTGDAVHFQWGFRNEVGAAGGTTARNALAQQSAEGIFAFAKQFPGVTIHFGHQPPL